MSEILFELSVVSVPIGPTRVSFLVVAQAFKPDIIFVSAGFDGHEDDLIGMTGCVEEDYVWVTQQLVAVANSCCQGSPPDLLFLIFFEILENFEKVF